MEHDGEWGDCAGAGAQAARVHRGAGHGVVGGAGREDRDYIDMGHCFWVPSSVIA